MITTTLNDDELIKEMTCPKYQSTSAGKIRIESKLDMKKRYAALAAERKKQAAKLRELLS